MEIYQDSMVFQKLTSLRIHYVGLNYAVPKFNSTGAYEFDYFVNK